MYDDLEHVAPAMSRAGQYTAPEAVPGMSAIGRALSACASNLDTALRATADDAQRQRLRTIYRGLMASSRAASQLAESIRA